MADFNVAIPVILRHEGGYVDNKRDPGGATNFGVSLRWLLANGQVDKDHDGILDGDFNHDGIVDARDIATMSVADATAIYKREWWDYFGYGNISSDAVATKVFDMAVNMGGKQAHKLLQRAINRCGNDTIAVDGVLGNQTLAATNAVDGWRLLSTLRGVQADFYRGLVWNNPRLAEFLNGWLNRAYDLI
jgi:lysozyme family protein